MKTFLYMLQNYGFPWITCSGAVGFLAYQVNNSILSAGLAGAIVFGMLFLYLWQRQRYCKTCGDPTPGLMECQPCWDTGFAERHKA